MSSPPFLHRNLRTPKVLEIFSLTSPYQKNMPPSLSTILSTSGPNFGSIVIAPTPISITWVTKNYECFGKLVSLCPTLPLSDIIPLCVGLGVIKLVCVFLHLSGPLPPPPALPHLVALVSVCICATPRKEDLLLVLHPSSMLALSVSSTD